MAQPFSSRDDIKKDPFQEVLKVSLEWIAAHRQTFLSVAGTVVVALGVGAFIFTNLASLKRQAWERYGQGVNWMFAGNPGNAMSQFNDVTSNFSHTPAAAFAHLSKGDLLFEERKPAEAVESYRQALARDPPKIVRPLALSDLGSAQENGGDFAGAIETYKQFIAEYPDHFLAPKIYESLGRVYEISKNQDAAKETYEKIITMFPGTFWSEKARLRYQALSPQPFQSAPAGGGTPAPRGGP